MGITITPRKGCWIKYQLNLRRITQEDVAQKAGVSSKMVSHFITGRKNSHCLIENVTEKGACLKLKMLPKL
jgi:transcriptional regulator with XRE-family HTH domain